MDVFSFLRSSVLAGLVLSCGMVSSAGAESLTETVRAAWMNHPSIAAAMAGSHYAAQEVREEKSAYYPEINLSATGGRQYANNSTSRGLSVTRGAGYSNLWDATISLRQGLYDGGERSSRVKAATHRYEATDSDLANVQDLLAGAVASSYVEILRVYRGLAMVDAQRVAAGDYVARIEAAVNDGAADESEYNQAVDIVLSLDVIANQYEVDLHRAESAYTEIVGRAPSGAFETPLVQDGLIPVRAGEAIEVAQSGHAALQRMVMEAEAAAHEIDVERAALFPNIDGELSYLKSEKRDIIGGEAEDARAVVRMNWDFEIGGGAQRRIDKRKYRYEEMQARVREIERQIERDVRMAYAEYEGALKGLATQDQRLQVAQQLLVTQTEQFEGARISLLQLMQAENQAFLTHLDQIAAQHRILNAQYGILTAMGKARILGGDLKLALQTGNSDE